jgi:hypothetical protein
MQPFEMLLSRKKKQKALVLFRSSFPQTSDQEVSKGLAPVNTLLILRCRKCFTQTSAKLVLAICGACILAVDKPLLLR